MSRDYEIVYDDDGEPIGRAYSISTNPPVVPRPAPDDHPARAHERRLLVPKPGDLSDLIVAHDLPGR